MTIGKRIQAARKRAGYTQKKLAEICDVATGTIQQYELDKRQPRIEQLQKIASALNIDARELLEWKDIPEVRDEVYSLSLSMMKEDLSNKRYNFESEDRQKLIDEIDNCIAIGNQINDLNAREEYFFNKRVKLSHKILDGIMAQYLEADITDINNLVSLYLSFTDAKQGAILELLIDLYENKYLRKDYWKET